MDDRSTCAVEKDTARHGTAREHLTWLGAGLVVGFGVPFVFADVLRLPRDVYYGVYIAAVLAFFVLWARATGQRLAAMVRRRWRLAVVLGLVFALLLGFVVVWTEPGTAGPQGLALIWAVLWRHRDFRSALLARPVTADVVWSVPTLVTLNPIGTPITHAGMHVAAVVHSYETEVFLPPHR